MPCLTQALTLQPVGAEGSGEAERTSPRSRAERSSRKVSRAEGSLLAAGPAAKWRSTASLSCVMFIASRVYQFGERRKGGRRGRRQNQILIWRRLGFGTRAKSGCWHWGQLGAHPGCWPQLETVVAVRDHCQRD